MPVSNTTPKFDPVKPQKILLSIKAFPIKRDQHEKK